MTPPIRFLVGVIGLWCLGRTGVLLWPEEEWATVRARAVEVPGIPIASARQSLRTAGESDQSSRVAAGLVMMAYPGEGRGPVPQPAQSALRAFRSGALGPDLRRGTLFSPVALATGGDDAARDEPAPLRLSAPTTPASGSAAVVDPMRPALPARTALAMRPSVTAWALWRPGEGGASGLGTGTLGGSQAGARLTVPILSDRLPGFALSARASMPLRRRGAEAALGVEWQPVRHVPVRLLGERRQRITGEGRNAFALLAHGGVSGRALPGGFALDGYGAAGVVGLRSRDLFAEGTATVTREVGAVRVGAGAWGGVQPGVSRLDVGPTVALPLRIGGAGVRVSLDYRLRVAGSAAPDSGPALTIGTDF